MARKSLTSFERRCLLTEVLQRRQLGLPEATAVVTEHPQKVTIKVTGNWHPNPVEVWASNIDEARNLAPELFHQRTLLTPEGQPHAYQPRSSSYTDKELLALIQHWDGEQRKENVDSYLKHLEQRQKFIDAIGTEKE